MDVLFRNYVHQIIYIIAVRVLRSPKEKLFNIEKAKYVFILYFIERKLYAVVLFQGKKSDCHLLHVELC